MSYLPRVRSCFPVGFVIFGLLVGCSPAATKPSTKTAALESSLLTVVEVGGDFAEEGRDQFGASPDVAISLCPESDLAFLEVGGVSVRFIWPTSDPDPIKLFETLRIIESPDLDTLMADLEGAIGVCDGFEWTDYGDTYSWTTMNLPEVGDRLVAVQSPTAWPPQGRFDLNRIVWVASGDVLVEIITWETLDGPTDIPTISDDDLHRIVAAAVADLHA